MKRGFSRPGRRVSWVFAFMLAVVVLALPASLGAAPTWLGPLDLSAPDRDAKAPDVAMDPAGNAVAVWVSQEEGDTRVQAAVRPAGGAWSAPQNLSAGGVPLLGGALAEAPRVALDSSGNAVAVWVRRGTGRRFDPAARIVQAAVRPAATGVWSPAQNLSDLDLNAARDAYTPDVAVNGAGDAVAIWKRFDGTERIVQASMRPAGGDWGAAEDLAMIEWEGRPHVGLSSAGTAIAVWSHRVGAVRIVQAAVRPAGGPWSAPRDLSTSDAVEPRVAVNPAGGAAAVWSRHNGADWIVEASIRPAGGDWSATKELSGPSYFAPNPQVAFDPAGNAIAVWWRLMPVIGGVVQAAVRPAGGDWGAAKDLSPRGGSGYPQVALDPDGNAVAVWLGSDGTKQIAWAAMRPAGGDWSAAKDLSAPGQDATSAEVAVDSAGNGVAVWQRSNGTKIVVQGAGLDGAEPVLGGLAIPSTGTAGVPLSFSVSPFDVWSSVSPPHWTFGDGGAVDGTTVSHTYASASSYAVTVTAVDGVGNETSTSRTISITSAPPSPPPAPPSIQAVRCVVPNVVGKKLAKAKTAIKKRNCRTGTVGRKYSKMRKGFVLAQRPKAGKRLANGARVHLTVSRGRRSHR